MVDLFQVNRVKYVWNEETGDRLPLCYLYFCKYCLDIRSAKNLLHEVDSHYCPQSLDGVSTTEAASKKNKSATCWQCPACLSLLATRVSFINLPDPNDPTKQTTRKSYLSCPFCRWSTKDLGTEDNSSATGGLTEKEIPNIERINEVMDYYKLVAQKEISDAKNAKRKGQKSLVMQLQQKYGSYRLYGRKPHPASPLSALASRVQEYEDSKQGKLVPPLQSTFSIQDIKPLPEEVYKENVDFTKLSSIDQRHSQPEHQKAEVTDYMPRKAIMFVKRSLRCKECQHILIKPEYHATSIKFKMELVALHYVPEIRLHRQPILKAGERNRVTLVVINRTDHTSHVTLSRMHQENLSFKVAQSMCELPLKELAVSGAQVGEYKLVEGGNETEEEQGEIAFRENNKVGFYVWVTPHEDLSEGDEVWISFNMKYDYQSTMAILLLSKSAEKPPEPEVNWLCHRVFVNLGRL